MPSTHMIHQGHNGSPVVLRAERIGRTYSDGEVTALADVSMEIRRGEYVAIMGPSGSGKSTLLNLLGTLDRPTSGELYFEGQPLSKLDDLDGFRSRKIGFVFQSFYLLPTLTAVENVQIPMFETGVPASKRVERADGIAGMRQHGASGQSPADAAFGRRTSARGHCPSFGERTPFAVGRRADGQFGFALWQRRFQICSTNCTASTA